MRFVAVIALCVASAAPVFGSSQAGQAGRGRGGQADANGFKVGDTVEVDTAFGWMDAQIVQLSGSNYQVRVGPNVVLKSYPVELHRKGPFTDRDHEVGLYDLKDRTIETPLGELKKKGRRLTVLQPLTAEGELDAAIARSFTTAVIIFKHSETCGTSHYAREEILTLLEDADLAAEVYVVSVQRHRAISNALSKQFGLRHESPQVLLIRRGALAWNASHHRVTSDELTAALQRTA